MIIAVQKRIKAYMNNSSSLPAEIGIRLKRMRRNRHMTLQDMGEILGVTRSTVSQYELGKVAPSLEVLMIYCDYFHVDMNEIAGMRRISRDLHLPALTAEEICIIEGYRRRDEMQKDIIRKLCWNGEAYRTEVQERNEKLKEARRLLDSI